MMVNKLWKIDPGWPKIFFPEIRLFFTSGAPVLWFLSSDGYNYRSHLVILGSGALSSTSRLK